MSKIALGINRNETKGSEDKDYGPVPGRIQSLSNKKTTLSSLEK